MSAILGKNDLCQTPQVDTWVDRMSVGKSLPFIEKKHKIITFS